MKPKSAIWERGRGRKRTGNLEAQFKGTDGLRDASGISFSCAKTSAELKLQPKSVLVVRKVLGTGEKNCSSELTHLKPWLNLLCQFDA